MNPSPKHTKAMPWAAILLALALVFPAFLTLSLQPAPVMMIPVTGQAETRTLFQTTQIALSGFFSGGVNGSPEAVDSANRSIQAAGWYRAAGGSQITIIPRSDRSLRAFEARWVETAPYHYRQDGGEGTLVFRANARGEITTAELDGSRVYRRLNWMQSPSLKIGLLVAGLLAAAALLAHRLRNPRAA